jgi:hypothetical protein
VVNDYSIYIVVHILLEARSECCSATWSLVDLSRSLVSGLANGLAVTANFYFLLDRLYAGGYL